MEEVILDSASHNILDSIVTVNIFILLRFLVKAFQIFSKSSKHKHCSFEPLSQLAPL